MSRTPIPILLASLALSITGCASSQQQPADSPAAATAAEASAQSSPGSRAATPGAGEDEGDICADQQPTGDPPACPSGCVWDESKHSCMQLRGVIVDQRPLPRPSPLPDDMRPGPKPMPQPQPTPRPMPAPTPQPASQPTL
ncbi:hypothetical protein WMF30_08365 [Sorangium sp. So ce134]